MGIDQITLNFDARSLQLLNIVLGVVMFGIALNFETRDLKHVFRAPKPFIIGLLCQFLLLPALAFAVINIFSLAPSIGLGLLLVSTSPGGNLSNLFTSISGGNVALSVSMSGVSTMLSVIMTPLNLSFWGGLNPHTSALLKSISLDPLSTFVTVVTILIIPLILGLLTKMKFPALTQKVIPKFNFISFLAFFIFAFVGFLNNSQYFFLFIGKVFWPVFWTNVGALGLAILIALNLGLSVRDSKAIGFEVGVQNAGFALILVFNFFNGLGGMAVVAAWWGIWHVISGGSLAYFLKRNNLWSKNG